MMLSAIVSAVGVAEVDLVLAGAPSWRLNSTEMPSARHRDRLAAEVAALAECRVVEVAAGCRAGRGLVMSPSRLEEVELDLGVRVEREAFVAGLRRPA